MLIDWKARKEGVGKLDGLVDCKGWKEGTGEGTNEQNRRYKKEAGTGVETGTG